ncbi:hypothetical protein P692DRAFT_20387782 [Suillus brevipes Sb2]|nr:hypothetical protein P692DRAFT_20387782 [Suillus brevipes Sb2]
MLEVTAGENEELKGDPSQEGPNSGTGPPVGSGFHIRAAGPDENRIRQLTDMGFPRSAAERALARTHNNVNAATELLLSQPYPFPPDPQPNGSHELISVSLGGDLLAGVTLAAMLIPQSVSYGTSLAKLSPTTGLFAAAIPPIMYSLLGTSRQLNVAPEAALSLLVRQAVSDYRRGDHHTRPEDADAISIAVVLQSPLPSLSRLGCLRRCLDSSGWASWMLSSVVRSSEGS